MEKLTGSSRHKLQRASRQICQKFFGGIFREAFKAVIDVLFPQDPMTAALEAISQGNASSRDDFFALLPEAPPAPPEYPWIHSCFAYKNVAVERIVWAVKYERNKLLADLVAEAILAKILEIVQGEKRQKSDLQIANDSQIQNRKIVIVPLPSSKRRIRERGYDHIGLIAEALQVLKLELELDADSLRRAKCGYDFYISSILRKQRHTKPQSKLDSREERLHNLAGAFSIVSEAGVDHTINPTHTYILIDDVCTTGATLAAARECLIAAGASDVIAVTFAR